MKFSSLFFLLLSLQETQSSFLRVEPSTESSSGDANTESSSADEAAQLPGIVGFDDVAVWEEHLKSHLDTSQYDSISRRSLQFDDNDPVIWIPNTWSGGVASSEEVGAVLNFPPMEEGVPTFPAIDEIGVVNFPAIDEMSVSDFPSMTPSDVPSMAPSPVPSSLSDVADQQSFKFVDAEADPLVQSDLLQIVMNKAELNWFKIMLDKGDYKHVLEEKEGITVLAPVNEAFQNLDRRLLGKLLLPEFALHVRDLVRYHILWWQFTSDGLVVGRKINTMEQDGVLGVILGDDGEIQLTSDEGPPASFLDTDITGANGELHVIDQVLLPSFTTLDAMTILEESVENMSLLFQTISHNKFLAMVEAAGLQETLRGLEEATVFLPDDDGIEAEVFDYLMTPGNEETLRAVVEYHMIPFALNFELFKFMLPYTYMTVQGEAMTITRRVGLVVNDYLTISLTLMKCGHVYHTNGLLMPPSLVNDIVNHGNSPF